MRTVRDAQGIARRIAGPGVVALMALAGYGGAGEGAPSAVASPSGVVVASRTAAPPPPSPTPRPFNLSLPPTFTPVGASALAYVCLADRVRRDPPSPECQVKGVVAPDGKRYFYVPGDRLYGGVAVDPANGDAWFRAAGDALAAGFRPAREAEEAGLPTRAPSR